MPSFDDFRRPFGERTHAQRLVTYGTALALCVLLTIVTWTGVWDLFDNSAESRLKFLPPVAGVFFAWRVLTEFQSNRQK